jgi:hypothetical protein
VEIVDLSLQATEHRLTGASTRAAVPCTRVSRRLRGAVTVRTPAALMTCPRVMLAGTPLDDAGSETSALGPRAVAS